MSIMTLIFKDIFDLSIPLIPLNLGLWPFMYNIKIKNLKDKGTPKIDNRTALFKLLPDQQLLHLKLPHIIEYVLQYEYEYSSFLGKTSGKGEYQIINIDLAGYTVWHQGHYT